MAAQNAFGSPFSLSPASSLGTFVGSGVVGGVVGGTVGGKVAAGVGDGLGATVAVGDGGEVGDGEVDGGLGASDGLITISAQFLYIFKVELCQS